jgi:hypothetical protein
MASKKITLATVRKIGLTFPGVEEGKAFGAFALKVGGKLMACVPTHRSAEPDSLLIRADDADRDALIAEAPEIYYVKEHYLGYNSVLVRLSAVSPDALRDLLGMSYKFVTRKKAPRPSKRRSRSPN